MSFHTKILEMITSGTGSLTGLVTNLIISTIVGGLVFLVVVKVLGKKLGDNIGIPKIFTAVFIINLINIPIIWGLTVKAIAAIPFTSFIFPFLPFLAWFLVVKMIFGQMKISHCLLISAIGYILSIYVIPMLVGSLSGVLPF